ncbi:MAG: hypothetical protein GW762_02055 [Candidatus Pacebacteria bacterium]|nr:hypothetical protein [Candidatus Paceibacterota bacterium]PIR63930.1 MAG: hypothetical protein COU64_01890 [Candidatus Pacebacteria bacterium CG10_big_fil_rev_8_21_14_0_10_40_26]PIZ78429.1 MAG: hypothetical protein COY01_04185 [Candidatus Pacebacteria bacterium CG_4_10_14_0_2_um_filter_40_20]PJA69279.1 MAG: hypothetical protein CO156_00070 [Candidatus Pacebacteria bacterium CG_4_9_14_3_um_filter_40_12]PJC41962.1 MAG: hypothetical protein CO041_01625 [Candidatus Pacebacteria bacterium CG_4_9_
MLENQPKQTGMLAKWHEITSKQVDGSNNDATQPEEYTGMLSHINDVLAPEVQEVLEKYFNDAALKASFGVGLAEQSKAITGTEPREVLASLLDTMTAVGMDLNNLEHRLFALQYIKTKVDMTIWTRFVANALASLNEQRMRANIGLDKK